MWNWHTTDFYNRFYDQILFWSFVWILNTFKSLHILVIRLRVVDLVSVCQHSIAKRAPPFSFLSVTDVVCARRRCRKKEFPPLRGDNKVFLCFFSFPALKLWTSFMCPISCFPLTNSVCSLSLYCITSFQPPGISCSCFVDLVLFIRFLFFFFCLHLPLLSEEYLRQLWPSPQRHRTTRFSFWVDGAKISPAPLRSLHRVRRLVLLSHV